ncbi:MAG: CBS domain-containing protein [Thermoplasmataceae archaeon]
MKISEVMTKDAVVLSRDSRVAEALSKMSELRIHQIPVVSGNEYLGVISSSEILRRRSLQLMSKVENFIINTPTGTPDMDIMEAVRVLRDSGVNALPVIDKKRLVGIVSRLDILKRIGEVADLTEARNSHIMSDNPLVARTDDTTDVAADHMRDLGESEIPVVDGGGRLSGILRMDSIVSATRQGKDRVRYGEYSGQSDKVKVSVGSISDAPVSVKLFEPVKTTIDLMTKHNIHLVPVVSDDQRVVGVVDVSDVLDLISPGEEKEGVLIEVSGLTPDDDDLYDTTYFIASKFIEKFSKITGHNMGKLNIHVIKYKESGGTKYSIRTRLMSGRLSMNQNGSDWNFGKCLSGIFDSYEIRIKKDKER